jgi:hypothetical protein
MGLAHFATLSTGEHVENPHDEGQTEDIRVFPYNERF